MLNTIVLSAAIVFEALAFRTAWNEFNLQRGNTNFWDAVRTSKDPTTVTVLFEDSAAMAGLIVALVGVHLAHLLEMPILDGIASMAIGLILFSVAAFLAWESKKLLVGEAAHPDVQASVRAIANEQSGVAGLGRVLTLHMGPYNLVLNMEVNFEADRTTADISRTIDALEDAVRTAHPEIKYIFVEAGSLAGKRRGTNASSEQNA
jgi:divalent metal cation (Fe/Co/Zn/Cd) transporter